MSNTKKSQTNKKSDMGVAKVAGVIGGIAAAATVGAYFLYHNVDAKKKMKHVKSWMIKARGEVLEKVEKLKEVNKDVYQNTVDGVLARYAKLSTVDTAELAKISKELKAHWNKISNELKASGKSAVAGVKAVKKVVKKTKKAVTKA